MKISQLVLIAALSCSFATVSSAKEGKGQGNPKKEEKHAAKHAEKHGQSDEKGAKGPDSAKTFTISQRERDVLHDYVQACHATPNRDLPPGLAKKVARGKGLPPGWQKKMAVGQVCPPDIFKVCQPLPKDLVIKLPPSPVGTITVAVEGKIVRLLEKTKEILDIIDLPVPGSKRS